MAKITNKMDGGGYPETATWGTEPRSRYPAKVTADTGESQRGCRHHEGKRGKVLEREPEAVGVRQPRGCAQQGAAQFEQQAGKLKRKYWWKT
ncbi:hypothetical protein KQX54_000116 [Cotesia glomerata]|uniref:Uncharacterized protein n=1 Tax=Cotesia glomerata TaxID=32391 RepID=A0AAV7IYL6_COTGL|nr:hypothetical protein KQX54_000116 [Cotesia glomerata]